MKTLTNAPFEPKVVDLMFVFLKMKTIKRLQCQAIVIYHTHIVPISTIIAMVQAA